MTLISLPNTLVAGTPEDITDVDANIKAIRDVVNGLLGTDNFAAGSLNASVLVNSSVSLGKLAADSVDASKIVTGGVTTSEILDGTIGPADLALAEYVDVCKTTSSALSNGVRVAIDFDTARHETVPGLWDAADGDKLVCTRTGLWLVNASISATVTDSDVWRISHCISKYSAGDVLVADYGFQGPNLEGDAHINDLNGHQAVLSRLVPMTAGEYCRIEVFSQFVLGGATLVASEAAGDNRYSQDASMLYVGRLA